MYVSRAKIRALGEQVIATLKTWRLLRKLRCSTTRIDDLVKATLALHRGHHAEVGKWLTAIPGIITRPPHGGAP